MKASVVVRVAIAFAAAALAGSCAAPSHDAEDSGYDCASHCAGCCSPSGACTMPGTAASSCGLNGAACKSCGPTEQCVLGSCVPVAAEDAGDDAGAPPDAGEMDSGMRDAGGNDAGTTDAGTADAGAMDAGRTDAGPGDAGAMDAGSPSLSFFDAGTPARLAVGPCGVGAMTQRSYRSYWQDDFRLSRGMPDDHFAVGTNLPQINNEQQYYQPSQVRVDSAGLHLVARRVSAFVAADGKAYSYVSGEVYTANRAGARGPAYQSYGRWEVCASLPSAQGSWPAIWLLRNAPGGVPGNNPWPPEIDVMGHVGNLTEVQTNVFWGPSSNVQSAEMRHPGVPSGGTSGFHLYAVEFDGTAIDYFVDATRVRSYTVTANIPAVPMYLILNLAVGGVLPSYRPPCDSPTPGVNMTCANGVAAYDAGVEMIVRYARAYQ